MHDACMHAQPVVDYYCRTYTKAVRGGGSEEGRRVLWDATSRGLCVHGRVGHPRTAGTKKKLKNCFQRSNRPPMAGQVSEVEETLKRCPLKPENKEESGVRQSCSYPIYFLFPSLFLPRLGTHSGFSGYLIVDGHGLPIRSSLDHALAVQYSGLITTLVLTPLQQNSNSCSSPSSCGSLQCSSV